MELSIKQRNELLTGIILAQELKPVIEGTRRFITVKSFKENENGSECWTKQLPQPDDYDRAIFTVKVYSIDVDYIEKDYDVDENDTVEYSCTDDIKSFELLYSKLSKYMNDFIDLKPQWYCDNPIE
jgi:hypothetical protein